MTFLSAVVLFVVLQCSLVSCAGPGQTWAVLAAGGASWEEYWSEADICSIYQLLHRHNVPDRNIITFFSNTVATDPKNDAPGTIRSKPNGPNVYKNMLMDYTGQYATADNFIKVLAGDWKPEMGMEYEKVLMSGPNDILIVFFSGKGDGRGLKFPDRYLEVTELQAALSKLRERNGYRQILIHVLDYNHNSTKRLYGVFQRNSDNVQLFLLSSSSYSGELFKTLETEDWTSRPEVWAVAATDPLEESALTHFYSDTHLATVFYTSFFDVFERIEKGTRGYGRFSVRSILKSLQERVTTSHVTIWGGNHDDSPEFLEDTMSDDTNSNQRDEESTSCGETKQKLTNLAMKYCAVKKITKVNSKVCTDLIKIIEGI